MTDRPLRSIRVTDPETSVLGIETVSALVTLGDTTDTGLSVLVTDPTVHSRRGAKNWMTVLGTVTEYGYGPGRDANLVFRNQAVRQEDTETVGTHHQRNTEQTDSRGYAQSPPVNDTAEDRDRQGGELGPRSDSGRVSNRSEPTVGQPPSPTGQTDRGEIATANKQERPSILQQGATPTAPSLASHRSLPVTVTESPDSTERLKSTPTFSYRQPRPREPDDRPVKSVEPISGRREQAANEGGTAPPAGNDTARDQQTSSAATAESTPTPNSVGKTRVQRLVERRQSAAMSMAQTATDDTLPGEMRTATETPLSTTEPSTTGPTADTAGSRAKKTLPRLFSRQFDDDPETVSNPPARGQEGISDDRERSMPDPDRSGPEEVEQTDSPGWQPAEGTGSLDGTNRREPGPQRVTDAPQQPPILDATASTTHTDRERRIVPSPAAFTYLSRAQTGEAKTSNRRGSDRKPTGSTVSAPPTEPAGSPSRGMQSPTVGLESNAARPTPATDRQGDSTDEKPVGVGTSHTREFGQTTVSTLFTYLTGTLDAHVTTAAARSQTTAESSSSGRDTSTPGNAEESTDGPRLQRARREPASREPTTEERAEFNRAEATPESFEAGDGELVTERAGQLSGDSTGGSRVPTVTDPEAVGRVPPESVSGTDIPAVVPRTVLSTRLSLSEPTDSTSAGETLILIHESNDTIPTAERTEMPSLTLERSESSQTTTGGHEQNEPTSRPPSERDRPSTAAQSPEPTQRDWPDQFQRAPRRSQTGRKQTTSSTDSRSQSSGESPPDGRETATLYPDLTVKTLAPKIDVTHREQRRDITHRSSDPERKGQSQTGHRERLDDLVSATGPERSAYPSDRDRIVEKLYREIERKSRIERERRGL